MRRTLPTEQAAFRVSLAQTAGNERDERMPRARTALMQVSGERLAPRTGLAHQKHRRRIGGDLLQFGAQLLHLPALADRNHQYRRQQLARLAAAFAGIQRALDGSQQLGQREWLLDEVEGAQTGSFYRSLHGAMAGHHHDRTAV